MIFSPSRPSPSKPAGWFSFKGVTNMFSPPKPERNSQDYKYASALAYSLNMDRAAFLAMEPETSIEDDDEGNPLYSYKELLRRQYTKMYLGLPIECLERFLVDDEFNFHFGMSKVCPHPPSDCTCCLCTIFLHLLTLSSSPLTRKSFMRSPSGSR